MCDPIDVRYDAQYDVLDPNDVMEIFRHMDIGEIVWLWLAPPCFSHSVARNGQKGVGELRSRDFPEGVPPLHPDSILGNKLSDTALGIFDFAVGRGTFATV